MAEPVREEAETAPNPHVDGEVLEFRRITFHGLELYGLVRSGGEFWPVLVTITAPKWKVRDGLNVGTNADRIEKVLGQPMHGEGNVLRYEGETERVNFHLSAGAIAKVEFVYYLD